MKSLKLTKKVTDCLINVGLVSILAAMGVSLVHTAAYAAAGNGGGTNGPVLDGEAIPVKLDRGVSIAKIKQAINVCMIEGDIERGLVSVNDRIAKQMLEEFSSSGIASLNSSMNKDNIPSLEVNVQSFLSSKNQTTLANFAFFQNMSQVGVGGKKEVPFAGVELTASIFHYGSVNTEKTFHFGTDRAFPLVSWEKVEKEPVPDELGDIDENQTIVSGLRIEKPKNYVENYQLFNLMTGNPTSLVAPAKEYIECLYGEIQR